MPARLGVVLEKREGKTDAWPKAGKRLTVSVSAASLFGTGATQIKRELYWMLQPTQPQAPHLSQRQA